MMKKFFERLKSIYRFVKANTVFTPRCEIIICDRIVISIHIKRKSA